MNNNMNSDSCGSSWVQIFNGRCCSGARRSLLPLWKLMDADLQREMLQWCKEVIASKTLIADDDSDQPGQSTTAPTEDDLVSNCSAVQQDAEDAYVILLTDAETWVSTLIHVQESKLQR